MPTEFLHTNITDVATDIGQYFGDFGFKGLFLIAARLVF